MAEWPDGRFSTVKDTWKPAIWPQFQESCLEEIRHRSLPAQDHTQWWSMVVAGGGVFQWQGLGGWSGLRESWTEQSREIYLMKTWFRMVRTLDWAEGLPSNRAMIVSTQQRPCRSGFGTTLWMSLSGPARALTWTQSSVSGETWKGQSTDGPHATWQSLRGSAAKNGRKSPNSGVVSYPRRLEAIIAAKGASTKYWVKGLGCVSQFQCTLTSYEGF